MWNKFIPIRIQKVYPNKKFCYLGQGESDIPERFNELKSANSDFIWLSFKEPVKDGIYLPTSTWTQGRNNLYKYVLEKERIQGWNYNYYIFIDGDISIRYSDSNLNISGWRRFEQYLLKYNPAVASVSYTSIPFHDLPIQPKFGLKNEIGVQNHFDAILSSFHHEAAQVLLPYEETYDAESWW